MGKNEGTSVDGDINQSSVNVADESAQSNYCAEQVSHHPPGLYIHVQ